MHLICNSLKKLLKQPKALTCYILNLNISLIYIYIYDLCSTGIYKIQTFKNFQKLTSQNSSENSIEWKKTYISLRLGI